MTPQEPITVWLHPAMINAFETWLAANDKHLWQMPTAEGRLYAVGIGGGPRLFPPPAQIPPPSA